MKKRQGFLTEFLLIAAGVLVALMVDSWIESRRDAELRDEYLKRLADDVSTDVHNISERVKFFHQVGEFGVQTLDWLASDESPGHETLGAAFMASERWAFQPIAGTYEDLQSTGNLRLIDDIELRLLLAAYHSMASRRQGGWWLPEDYRQLVRGLVSPDIQQEFRRQCNTISFGRLERSTLRACWPDGLELADFEDDLLALRRNPNTRQALNYTVSEVHTAVMLFEDQRNFAQSLLEVINQKIPVESDPG